MNSRNLSGCCRIALSLVTAAELIMLPMQARSVLVLAGTNQTPNNSVAVFELSTGTSPSLTMT